MPPNVSQFGAAGAWALAAAFSCSLHLSNQSLFARQPVNQSRCYRLLHIQALRASKPQQHGEYRGGMTSNSSADVEIRLHNVVSSDISTRPIAAARQPPRFCCLVIIAAEPGNALVACSSTSRQLMLSRALVLAPLTVYSRMLGRPRGMACYCAAYLPTRAERFHSQLHSPSRSRTSSVQASMLDRQPVHRGGEIIKGSTVRCERVLGAGYTTNLVLHL
jgi:hypothetical protein